MLFKKVSVFTHTLINCFIHIKFLFFSDLLKLSLLIVLTEHLFHYNLILADLSCSCYVHGLRSVL